MEDEDFVIPPPDFSQGDYQTPYDQRSAMTLKLIKNKINKLLLPEEEKKGLYEDMAELINNSSMTNITRGQINEFLGDYDYIWQNYEIFINRKNRKEFNYVKNILRTIFKQNLNKSINGFYPSLVFEQRYKYEVTQKKSEPEERVRSWRNKFKPQREKGGETS